MLDILSSLDLLLLMKINLSWTSPWADWFFPIITDLHKSKFFFSIAAPLLCYLLFQRHGKKGLGLFVALILCLGTNDFLATKTTKDVFRRQRPFENSSVTFNVAQRAPAGGYSFVSNHAANMFCLALFSAYFIGFAKIFYIAAFFVGYSRIYNGVHFPSDVLGGALFGTLIALIFVSLLNRFYMGEKK